MSESKSSTALFIAVAIMFFAIPLFSPAQVSSEGSDAYQVEYTAEFSEGDLSSEKLMGYDVVRVKDGYSLAELGKPMLPWIELQIALPSGMAVKGVRILNTIQEQIEGEFNIFPAQPPRRIGDSEGEVDFVKPDQKAYSSSQPYPSNLVEFVHQSDLAGQSIAILQLYPLQYIPAENRLILYTSISLVIEGVDGYECGDYLSPNISEKGRRTYEQMVKEMVVNPEDVQLNAAFKMSTCMVPPGGPFDHVIITGPLHAQYYQLLIDWHNQKGLRDTVITTTWIYANYSGTTDREKIRSFISDAHLTWGTTYFLLGGEHETVPFEYRTYYAGESTPSDQYYSDYDDDWTNEVFVGRVTAESGFEIQTFVFKVLKYEKDPPRTDYPLDVLLIGMDLDDFTHEEVLKDTIDNYIPSRFNVTKVYDSHGGNHRDSVTYYLNAGQNIVNHADHSNWDVMGTGYHHHGWTWSIFISDVDALNNTHQTSIVVTVGCLTNYMDTTWDCIAEHFVIYNPNQAGVAFFGNTRDGVYSTGNPISRSAILDREWWASLFNRNKYNLGQTLADAKHHFSHSEAVLRHCEWTFNLLGEPAMPIWTDEPDSFAITCPDTLKKGKMPFPVHVEDSTTHDPVDSAYVCVWKEGEVYVTGYTDVNGDVTLHPVPATTGTLHVTVTKHNYIPCQREAYVPYICGDITKDGAVNASDVVYLLCYLFRGCPPPDPLEIADVNLDGAVNGADVVYLINYLYRDGPPPCDPEA